MKTAPATRRINRIVVVSLLAVATFAAVLVVDDGEPAGASTCATGSVERYERWADANFRSRLNATRSSRGLGPLALNWRLTDQADVWSASMLSTNTLRHDPNYAAATAKAVPNWTKVGENVGRIGMSWCTTAELKAATERAVASVHSAFVRSTGHLQNMVGGYNQVGIGVEINRSGLWVTVRFARGSVPSYGPIALTVNNLYVSAVHNLFIGRSATSAEQYYWSRKVIDAGRGPLTRALSVSNEWAGERIDDLYRTILGRSPDPGGKASWLAAVARGARLETIAAGFYGSPEYYRKSGGTVRSFVASLYQDILGRSAARSEIDSWAAKIAAGMSRQRVAAGFYGSYESRAQRVHDLYRIILGRKADPTGLRTWTTNLIGMGDVVLAATLATSGEYFNKAT